MNLFSTKFIGRGLGRSVTVGLLRAHDGTLGVESELGRGTTFKVFLPVIDEKDLRQSGEESFNGFYPSSSLCSNS